MLVWIVILFLWIALISLILHDATKGDSNGSAVVLAAGKIGLWIRRKARRFRRQNAKKTALQPSLKVLEPAKWSLRRTGACREYCFVVFGSSAAGRTGRGEANPRPAEKEEVVEQGFPHGDNGCGARSGNIGGREENRPLRRLRRGDRRTQDP